MIPKSKGKLRPLGLPSANDKIVQEVIRLILESVYEPNFDENSYGFRTGRGVHNALKHVDKTFRW
ncbi:MAG: group II intron reverse transcriptase/maturase, partial [Leptolyngbyaceae cyanobacterium SU_3_3]|nr:group II intron reverse transcriptase/maturase [Leptolyngbyaceae cyanobacterium SU_3_3]